MSQKWLDGTRSAAALEAEEYPFSRKVTARGADLDCGDAAVRDREPTVVQLRA